MREDREQPATHSVTHPPTRSPSDRVARVVAIQPPHLNPAPRLRLRCSPAPPLPPHPPLASSSSSSSSSSGTTTGWTDGPKQNKTYTHRLRPHAWLAGDDKTYLHTRTPRMHGRTGERLTTTHIVFAVAAAGCGCGGWLLPTTPVGCTIQCVNRSSMDGWMDGCRCLLRALREYVERKRDTTQRNAAQEQNHHDETQQKHSQPASQPAHSIPPASHLA